MGFKKEGLKRESVDGTYFIEDPINTADWRCAVVMAVEKSVLDTFVLKEFMEEASNGRRRQVNLIDYDHFVLKILTDFARGEIPYKYAFLTNFSAIFHEASEYAKNKVVIPVKLLVKVVKALLFFFREESIKKGEKKDRGPQDPVKAMAERPFNPVEMPAPKPGNPAKKNQTGGQDMGVKIRPPSHSKEETKLLKRGEGAKETQCIDDAPPNAYFKMYVLLTGFYHPDFPAELIKAKVPLHGLLCIDTALSGLRQIPSATHVRNHRKPDHPSSSEIKMFWKQFLNTLWNPQSVPYFKDVIFQVYSPKKLLCDKKKLREFVYKEISYLMYDLSDYMRLHSSYLSKLKLWNVEDTLGVQSRPKRTLALDELPCECVTVPALLGQMLHIVCADAGEDECRNQGPRSVDSIDSQIIRADSSETFAFSDSVVSNLGSSTASPPFSQIVFQFGDVSALKVYAATNDLDSRYHLNGTNPLLPQDPDRDASNGDTSNCPDLKTTATENLKEPMHSENAIFRSHWKKLTADDNLTPRDFSLNLDYCLYSFLISKITCPHQPPPSLLHLRQELHPPKGDTTSEIIHIWGSEMPRPHFNVTECSRTALKRIPFNPNHANQHFFHPQALKITAPDRLKANSAPEVRVPSYSLHEMSFISDLVIPRRFMNRIEWNVYENLDNFLGNGLLSDSNGFNVVEELTRATLLARKNHYWEDFNCVDYGYSVLTDSLFVVIHNKKDSRNSYQEQFNNKLKTRIGLRDFFEYVLEEEAHWVASEEELRKKNLSFMAKNAAANASPADFMDSDFWSEYSIKHENRSSSIGAPPAHESANRTNAGQVGDPDSASSNQKLLTGEEDTSQANPGEPPHCFEGYDIDDLPVQFSGVKTTYFAGDCSITADLTERLYGNQQLGVHIRQGGHTLHLYSYVCPKPHIATDPFTCHVTTKSGIILAFSKRTIKRQIADGPEDTSDSQMPPNQPGHVAAPPSTSTLPATEDDQFLYDFTLSLPNGLSLDVLRDSVKPCHIRQRFLNGSCGTVHTATSVPLIDRATRLFLPDGSLVRISRDATFQVLKTNTFVLTSSMDDLAFNGSSPALLRYELISSEGVRTAVDSGRLTSATTLRILENLDLESGRRFFRRADGTSHVIEPDGTLCVQFQDGTRMCHTPLVPEDTSIASTVNATLDDSHRDLEADYVIVHEKITFEHPDYATVTYNSLDKTWQIILPHQLTIALDSRGNYSVDVDHRTRLTVREKSIQMHRFSHDEPREVTCSVEVDLAVFDQDDPGGIYCRMDSSLGETYIIEPNSNNYLVTSTNGSITDDHPDGQGTHDKTPHKRNLQRDSKYYVVRKDMTAFEIMHEEDFAAIISAMEEGSVLHVRELDGLRCFVIISPLAKKPRWRAWQTDSVLQDPTFRPEGSKKEASSTYAHPPSWMHPFPKGKPQFHLPDILTCRVFVETRRTNLLLPSSSRLQCVYLNPGALPSPPQPRDPPVDCRTAREYAAKYLHADQPLLRETYHRTLWEAVSEKTAPTITQMNKLKRTLTTIRRDIDLQKYHEATIRHRSIPNYFHHSRGFCWLLLEDIVKDERFAGSWRAPVCSTVLPSPLPESTSSFSNEEVEYDLPWTPKRTFSELTCLTNISSKTAPAGLSQPTPPLTSDLPRIAASAPAIASSHDNPSETTLHAVNRRLCSLSEANSDPLPPHFYGERAFLALLVLGLV